jgi:hypothetical protein
MAQRATAVSYAFEGNCKRTVQYEQQVFDHYGNVPNFFQQGEIPVHSMHDWTDLRKVRRQG